MGYTLWSDYTEGTSPITWDLCQKLYDTRGHKRLEDRKPTDKDTYLTYKGIASYTYLAYDNKRSCWTVFLKYWSGNRWRKIIEVHLNNRWRIFSDTDEVYQRRGLHNVESVMALPDNEFSQTYVSNLGRHRINQMIPCHLYNKRRSWFVNNKHLPFTSGMEVSYQTNYDYPRWWTITPRSWVYSRTTAETQEVELASKDLNRMIKNYVNRFVDYTYQSPCAYAIPFCDSHVVWLDNLSTEGLLESKQDRYRSVVEWKYLKHESPDIILYKLICRADLIGRDDEVEKARSINSRGKPENFLIDKPFPVYLLYKAMQSETMLSEDYIRNFIENYECKTHSSEAAPRIKQMAGQVLEQYIMKFYRKFLILRATGMHDEITNGQGGQKWGLGMYIPKTLSMPGSITWY